jgi:hypothetical protein
MKNLDVMVQIATDVLAYEPPATSVRTHPHLRDTFRKVDGDGVVLQQVESDRFTFAGMALIVDASVPADTMIVQRHGQEAGRITITGLVP